LIEYNIDNKSLGFAFEGAAMALVISDFLKPLSNKFKEFLNVANKHEYMLYVGAGWAVAKLPFKRLVLSRLKKDILHALVYDGIGFYEGYFNWQDSIEKQKIPNYLKTNEYCFYDQGLGRSLWFVFGGNANKIKECIGKFPKHRRSDLWSGIGLAATYAGGREDSLVNLKKFSEEYYPNLAQGCTFASKARCRAENITVHNRYACKIFCDMTVEQAAKITDDCLSNLDNQNYEDWRLGIKKIFS